MIVMRFLPKIRYNFVTLQIHGKNHVSTTSCITL